MDYEPEEEVGLKVDPDEGDIDEGLRYWCKDCPNAIAPGGIYHYKDEVIYEKHKDLNQSNYQPYSNK